MSMLLADEAPPLRAWHAVYAIGPNEGKPLKIGFAKDIQRRLRELQASHWQKLAVHTVCWASTVSDARLVEEGCHNLLKTAGKHLMGEWFNITPDWAEKTMATASKHARGDVLHHREMAHQLEQYRVFIQAPDLFWPHALNYKRQYLSVS